MIPALAKGVLPPGVHSATLSEVRTTFATNGWRLGLYGGLRVALADLERAGCRRAWLDGSFVTHKDLPGDYDLCWDMSGVDFAVLEPVLLMTVAPRTEQSLKYRGDILPNVIESGSGKPILEFFQVDKNTGTAKGILELSLRSARP